MDPGRGLLVHLEQGSLEVALAIPSAPLRLPNNNSTHTRTQHSENRETIGRASSLWLHPRHLRAGHLRLFGVHSFIAGYLTLGHARVARRVVRFGTDTRGRFSAGRVAPSVALPVGRDAARVHDRVGASAKAVAGDFRVERRHPELTECGRLGAREQILEHFRHLIRGLLSVRELG